MRVITPAAEPLEIRTSDGRGLGAALEEPRGRRVLGTAVFAHPMFANKSVFARPRGDGLASLFLDAGWRTLTFDFRGHGESQWHGRRATPEEAPWGYDDLVRVDLPTVVEAARHRWPRSKLVVVGHSLGGHVALAAQGAGLIRADALVVAGTNVWMRRLEASRRLWWVKVGALGSMAALAMRHRSFPVRALRLGTDDEATPYIRDLARFALQGRWASADSTLDYDAALARIDAPTFALSSTGDRLYCPPQACERFLAPIPRARLVHETVSADDRGGPAPDHMGLVTDVNARDGWRRALAWLGTI